MAYRSFGVILADIIQATKGTAKRFTVSSDTSSLNLSVDGEPAPYSSATILKLDKLRQRGTLPC